jgi:hypothetical protein
MIAASLVVVGVGAVVLFQIAMTNFLFFRVTDRKREQVSPLLLGSPILKLVSATLDAGVSAAIVQSCSGEIVQRSQHEAPSA